MLDTSWDNLLYDIQFYPGGYPFLSDLAGQLLPYIHPDDLEMDYVQSPINYPWYCYYSRLKKPRAILEIGVRRGYSIIAMCLGHKPRWFCLIDSEIDGVENTEYFAEMTLREKIGVSGDVIVKRSQDAIDDVHGEYDIIHIDGEHTVDALRSDLRYSKFLAPDGWIIVDDVKDMPELMEVCREFAEPDWDLQYVDTFRGHAVMRRAVEDRCVMNGGSD